MAPLGGCGPHIAEPSLSPASEALPPTEPLLSAPLLRGSRCTSVLGICHELPLPLNEGAAAFLLPLFRREGQEDQGVLSACTGGGAAVGRKGRKPTGGCNER